MSALRDFEIEAIRLVGKDALTEKQLDLLERVERLDSYEYTGSGYFLSIENEDIPIVNKTLCDPPVVGNADGIQAGFIVYLENGKLTLECHTWGEIDVPEDFRNRNVLISPRPENFVDHRNAT